MAVAAAEMAFSGGLGMDLLLSQVPSTRLDREDALLFSESNSRFIVEVERKNQKAFEKILTGVPFGLIGCISEKKELKVRGMDGKMCIEADIEELKESWQKPLRW